MKLKEFEGKKLFEVCRIPVSLGLLVNSEISIGDSGVDFSKPHYAKIQTLQGGRGKKGGIQLVNSQSEAEAFVTKFLGKKFHDELVTEILFDEKVDIAEEAYLGILFDSSLCQPVLLVSQSGGIDIETSLEVKRIPIDYTIGISESVLNEIREVFTFNEKAINSLCEIVKKLYHCFVEFDLRMVEINPLVLDTKGNLIAVDSVAVLDDDAHFRWSKKVKFSERTGIRLATKRELAAREIDREDYRGVAGKTFLDLDGDIAILTSGGGASMTLMDTLTTLGGKPANFTEYSGNPPREKVEKLTRIVLDKKGLSGLLVAGVIANFTNIKETLQGVVDVLTEVKPDFPIVIRRAGPHDIEAKEMLMQVKKEHKLDIHYFDETLPLSKAAEVIVTLSNQYKDKNSVISGDKS